MKTLNINISESDFIKFNLQHEALTFDELVIKIKAQLMPSASNKSKFEDTPAFNIWQDREDMADVEHYVDELRKPRQHNVF
jgi:hypothetical protein